VPLDILPLRWEDLGDNRHNHYADDMAACLDCHAWRQCMRCRPTYWACGSWTTSTEVMDCINRGYGMLKEVVLALAKATWELLFFWLLKENKELFFCGGRFALQFLCDVCLPEVTLKSFFSNKTIFFFVSDQTITNFVFWIKLNVTLTSVFNFTVLLS